MECVGFHRDHVQRVETIRLAPPDQLQLASMVSGYDPPSVYVKHVCFTNFSQWVIFNRILRRSWYKLYIEIIKNCLDSVYPSRFTWIWWGTRWKEWFRGITMFEHRGIMWKGSRHFPIFHFQIRRGSKRHVLITKCLWI